MTKYLIPLIFICYNGIAQEFKFFNIENSSVTKCLVFKSDSAKNNDSSFAYMAKIENGKMVMDSMPHYKRVYKNGFIVQEIRYSENTQPYVIIQNETFKIADSISFFDSQQNCINIYNNEFYSNGQIKKIIAHYQCIRISSGPGSLIYKRFRYHKHNNKRTDVIKTKLSASLKWEYLFYVNDTLRYEIVKIKVRRNNRHDLFRHTIVKIKYNYQNGILISEEHNYRKGKTITYYYSYDEHKNMIRKWNKDCCLEQIKYNSDNLITVYYPRCGGYMLKYYYYY